MAIDVIKSTFGWSEVKKSGGTHKLLTNEEFENLEQEILQLTAEKRKAIQDAAEDRKKCFAEAQKMITEANNKTKAAQDALNYYVILNENLSRINKERSNAERKLQPKKEHTGYVVIQSEEKVVRFPNKNSKILMAWETWIQTPYTIDTEEDTARQQIDGELTPKDGEWLLSKISIDGALYDNLKSVVEDEQYSHRNIIFQKRLRANYKTGYWEVFYMHTKPISVAPSEMRGKN